MDYRQSLSDGRKLLAKGILLQNEKRMRGNAAGIFFSKIEEFEDNQ